MERYRIEDVQKVTVNGRKVKLFKAFEYHPAAEGWLYCGTYDAPQNTPNNRLSEYIDE